MKRIRHTPEQIVRKLREADAELAKGTGVPEICKALGVSENTYYRWRNQFGGIKADEMKRLKELEKENARLTAKLETANSRARQMLERVRFLRQQAQAAAPAVSGASAGAGGDR